MFWQMREIRVLCQFFFAFVNFKAFRGIGTRRAANGARDFAAHAACYGVKRAACGDAGAAAYNGRADGGFYPRQ